MPDQKRARELAIELILDHAKDIEYLSISERIGDFDQSMLNDEERDELASLVDDLISKATVRVFLPPEETSDGD